MKISTLMPASWPRSLWLLVATAVLFLLQLIPYTGIFLMLLAAITWPVLLLNLGFIGIALEAVFGKVSRLWLIIPLIYFGGYYLIREYELAKIRDIRAEFLAENKSQRLDFDPSRQDLLLQSNPRIFNEPASDILRYYRMPHVLQENGSQIRNVFLGSPETCGIVRRQPYALLSRVKLVKFFDQSRHLNVNSEKSFCSISAPATYTKPVVSVIGTSQTLRPLFLSVTVYQFEIHDERSGGIKVIRDASARPLNVFPTPLIGCGLMGSGSWRCEASFMRGRPARSWKGTDREEGAIHAIAAALALKRRTSLTDAVVDVSAVREMIEIAGQARLAEDIADLGIILENPKRKDVQTNFDAIRNHPDVISPFLDRIVSALNALQEAADSNGGQGRVLWSLIEASPDGSLAQHKTEIVSLLSPDNRRPWTPLGGKIYKVLDPKGVAQRDLLLDVLASPVARDRNLPHSWLAPFCKMGELAPPRAKRTLLTLWQKRASNQQSLQRDRSADDVFLYFTLARIGLKEKAGPVEQRFMGGTFVAIFNRVSPAYADALCDGSPGDMVQHFENL